jgi:hypothetical protein
LLSWHVCLSIPIVILSSKQNGALRIPSAQ